MSVKSVMQFVGFETYKIDYNLSADRDQSDSDIEFYHKCTTKTKNCFIVWFGVRLIDADRMDNNTLYLDVCIKGEFKVNPNHIDINNIIDDLVIPNGAAILFPYLRTLVSTITGFDTLGERIHLPTVNIPNLLKMSK